MTAVFLLGIVLFLLISVGLFIFMSNGFNGNNMFNNNQYHWDNRVGRFVSSYPYGLLQSGFLQIKEDNMEENFEIYKQASLNEEDRRYYLNNMAIGLVVIFSFALFFLIVGSFLYYNYSNFTYESGSTQKSVLFLLLVFVPFLLLLAGLLYSLRAQKLNFQFPSMLGMDRLYNQFGLDTTAANLIEDEENKKKVKMAKMIEQFNWILEINNRKQSAISAAKGLFIVSIVTALPLLIMAVSDYFSVTF